MRTPVSTKTVMHGVSEEHDLSVTQFGYMILIPGLPLTIVMSSLDIMLDLSRRLAEGPSD